MVKPKLNHMKIKTSMLALIMIIFASSNSFAQYKYDIGLRTSSFVQERYQLEQRFHLSTTTIVGTIAYGSNSERSSRASENYMDSTLMINSVSNHSTFYTVKVGVQKKIDFPESDQFYVGAAVGITLEPFEQNIINSTYRLDSSTLNIPSSYPFYFAEELSSEYTRNDWDYLHTRVALSFGMDVPITTRIVINAEASFAAVFRNNLNNSSFYIYLKPAISAGFRYRFGKSDS